MMLITTPHFEYKPWVGYKIKEMYDYDVKENSGEFRVISTYPYKSSTTVNSVYSSITMKDLFKDYQHLFGNIKSLEIIQVIALESIILHRYGVYIGVLENSETINNLEESKGDFFMGSVNSNYSGVRNLDFFKLNIVGDVK